MGEVYNLPADEFMTWLDYFRRHPEGEREDARNALLCALTANCHSTSRRFTVTDFMPRRGSTKPKTTGEMTTALKRMNVAMGGTMEG